MPHARVPRIELPPKRQHHAASNRGTHRPQRIVAHGSAGYVVYTEHERGREGRRQNGSARFGGFEKGLRGVVRENGHVSAFVLKVAAIVGMTACHVGVLFQDALPFAAHCACLALGGVTFPIMAFLVDEGYRHTSNVTRYAARLAVFALISQVPYGLFFDPVVLTTDAGTYQLPFTGNVLFTLLLGLGLVVGYERMRRRWLYWPLVVAAVAGSVVLDWGVVGPVMVLMCHVLTGRERRVLPALLPVLATGLPALFGVAAGDLTCLPELLYEAVGGMAAIVLLSAYGGARGRSLKWFFYAYYPLHIAVLGTVAHVFF